MVLATVICIKSNNFSSMPRTTCSDAGKNLVVACRWRKHNKKKAKARVQAEKAARAAAKAAKAAKAKKLQAATF